jgi:hypothetical protein
MVEPNKNIIKNNKHAYQNKFMDLGLSVSIVVFTAGVLPSGQSACQGLQLFGK